MPRYVTISLDLDRAAIDQCIVSMRQTLPAVIRSAHRVAVTFLQEKVKEGITPTVSGMSGKSIIVRYPDRPPWQPSATISSTYAWMTVTEHGHSGQRMPPDGRIRRWMTAKGMLGYARKRDDDRAVFRMRRHISKVGIRGKGMFAAARKNYATEALDRFVAILRQWP